MAQTVKVRLRKPARVFTFLSRNIALKRDEACVVRTDRGLEYGSCVYPPEDCSPQEEKRYKMSVVRRSTHHDDTTYKQIKMDEQRSKQLCREKIKERELPMKLVECEYSFDRKKIIFYFTAEDRVDFRELVRDLAQELKARIQLRHIQVRDEAKMVGGIGTCGRELCCTTWMREFIPISMKMAKRQNLSLNPSKISGQCGRLMCCLSYENDQYSKAKKSRAKPAADPAEIREKMEAKPEAAVDALKESTLQDVIEPKVREPIEAGSTPASSPEIASKKTNDEGGQTKDADAPSDQADSKKEGETASKEAAEGQKRPRRKRRRGGRGRGKKRNSGS